MPATLSVAASPSTGNWQTVHGVSVEARSLEAVRPVSSSVTSITFEGRQMELFTRLLDACAEASDDVEVPILPETFTNAEAFLTAIPYGASLPDVMVHPDGEIAFEWHMSSRRVLTVSVGESPSLAFASLIGEGTTYGREPFSGFFPSQIAYLLARVSAT